MSETETVAADAYGAMAKTVIDREPRCLDCGRRLAEYLTRPYSITCPRCKKQQEST